MNERMDQLTKPKNALDAKAGAKAGLEMRAIADGTIGKALLMLDIVESFERPVRFNEILKQSPFPKASTYRLLQSLVNQDMLSLERESGRYALGTRLIRLAHSSWSRASLAPIAAPFLDALAKLTGETIHLAKLDNGQVLYLDKRSAARPIKMFSDAGKIGPAYCTGVGKAMLAFLDAGLRREIIAQQSFYAHTEHTLGSARALEDELAIIRKEGVAFDREEHEPNIICIAVPILANTGAIIGGISITSSTLHSSLLALSAHEEALKKTARQIGECANAWMLS